MFKKILREIFSNNINYLYFWLFCLVLGFVQIFYIRANFVSLPDEVPFWYTKEWGLTQLADKIYLYTFPVLTFFACVVTLVLGFFNKKFFLRYGNFTVFTLCFCYAIILSLSMFRIISISLPDTVFFIPQVYMQYVLPFLFSFIFSLLATPIFIKFAQDKGIVTQPSIHKHPGMVLTNPSARGGGFVYTLVFLISSVFFITPSLPVIGVYISMALIAILGLMDDFQNTHPISRSRFLENPAVRLLLLIIIVSISVFFGLQIFSVTTPSGGVFDFSQINILSTLDFADLLSKVFTVLWVIWVLNLLSWSNGIDGQYSGVVGIISLAILVLALRYEPVTPEFKAVAVLSVISAGASFGLTPLSWHPSKIMWGFGAMSAGMALTGLAVLINAKVTATILIMLIPFLDALVTVVRRLIQKKNPLRGDKGHLHHILLDRGWSPRKIAIFYWVATAFSAYIAVTSAEQYLVRVTLILAGIVGSVLVLLNIIQIKKSKI